MTLRARAELTVELDVAQRLRQLVHRDAQPVVELRPEPLYHLREAAIKRAVSLHCARAK